MTDIPSLIERIFKENLRLVCKECHADVCDCTWMTKPGSIEECAQKTAEALSRLTASPLPEEIAGLIRGLRDLTDSVGLSDDMRQRTMTWKAAAALQQQAREIERLNVILGNHGVTQLEKTEVMLTQYNRIRELEAHCERLGQGGAERYWEGRWRDMQDERNKLRETLADMKCPRQLNAGTIAECTGRLECGCHEGAVFVKAGAAQE